ncbi:MAG: hypothetical protein IJM21_01725 [Clostridia bacterium]|nr:hypothetical protein [Clostridia bacterium]
MRIRTDFPGGNIVLQGIEGDTVFVERDLRDTEDDWFYWAFAVEDAAALAGRTVTFLFPSPHRVGRFGAAVSHDLQNWEWTESGTDDRFTYTFSAEEETVYFAHHMLYPAPRFDALCERCGLRKEVFARSAKGRPLPAARFGKGAKWILMTARHHACESTGSYVLEAAAEELCRNMPEGYSLLVVPFVDYDGVLDGDQGKNRRPHDHNRDYIASPIYDVVRKLIDFGNSHDLRYTFDFHSPWHMGEENDHVFFSRSTESMEPFTDRFGEFMKRETEKNELKYTGEWDVGPNEKWNNEKSPNSKNYFSKKDSVRLSVTMETPYYGVENGTGKISEEALAELGKAFGKSAALYIASEEKGV